MRPAEAVYRALTGRSPRTGVDMSPATLRELERAYGGVTKAAAAAGVSRETWRRWRAGTQTPRPANLERMQAAVRRERLAAGRRSRLLRGRPQMMVSGYMTVSSDTRHRALATEDLMPSQGQIAELIDAYDADNADRMERGLNDIIGNYVPGLVANDVDRLWIGATTWDGEDE